MSLLAWLALTGLGVAGLVALGMYIRWLLAEGSSDREAVLQSQLDSLKAANHLGREFFYAQSELRTMARGRPSGSVIDGEVVDGSYRHD